MAVHRARILFAMWVGALLVAACSFSPLRLLASGAATPPAAIALSRCSDVEQVLCLVTFGLEPPDGMLILLMATPGLAPGFEVAITHKGTRLQYPCEVTGSSPGIVYCTGPQLPLGSSILVQVYAAEGHLLLASGEFNLNALALPTVFVGNSTLAAPSTFSATRPAGTPQPGWILTRIAPSGTVVRTTATASATASPTETPTAGRAYPNPDN